MATKARVERNVAARRRPIEGWWRASIRFDQSRRAWECRLSSAPRVSGRRKKAKTRLAAARTAAANAAAPKPKRARKDPRAGPKTKPRPIDGAEKAHVPRPLAGRRHVRDVGLRRRDAAPEEAGQSAREQEQPQRVREPREEEGRGRAGEAQEEDGPAADPVGQPPEERGAHELGRRVGGEDRPHPDPGGPEALGVVGQLGQDEAEADEVDEDGEVDDGQAALQASPF